MKITFVIDSFHRKAGGGTKIVYTYSNHFAKCGHEVQIVFALKEPLPRYKGKLPYFIRHLVQKIIINKGPSWFSLNPAIKLKYRNAINESTIPDADVIFATAIDTARPVSKLSEKKGKKYYLIQDFENWAHKDEDVYETYRLGMTNIAISKWLAELVSQYDKKNTVLIANGIDTNVFHVTNFPENRKAHSIAMIYQTGGHKGFQYGYEALLKLKSKYADMECRIFGVSSRPNEWPDWIQYTQGASEKQLVEIYNNTAVFLCSSIIEGFGLCGAESMACGCALVSSAYKGVFTYAIPNETAIITKLCDSDALANAVVELFDNDFKRIDMAKKGMIQIQDLSWERAFGQMDELICKRKCD